MGHIATKGIYHNLRRRLDRNIVGMPPSKELYEILKLLYTEDEAALASQMPMTPVAFDVIARKTGMEPDRLRNLIESMADKGLVMDFHHESTGETYYVLSPPVVGFFEFSLMRTRSDIPQKQLAELMHKYLYDDDAFARDVFQQTTQLGRTLVHETALPENISEILSYEKASEMIKESECHSVSLCYCRHKQHHLDKDCEFPMEVCTAINTAAEFVIRRNFGRKSSRSEALDILAQSRERGLVQIGDNVKSRPGFICHCCRCCCGFLNGITHLKVTPTVMTSNYIAEVDKMECRGCKKCADRCPISAIQIKVMKRTDNKKKYRWAEVDSSLCLGCGVCIPACKNDALALKKRKQKVLTPENTFDRVLTMALERGKLQEFLFDGDKPPDSDILYLLTKSALNFPLTKRLLLQEQIKSRFIQFILEKAKPKEIV
ncbi:MAG: 4Fe-4S binding protein [bacterium]